MAIPRAEREEPEAAHAHWLPGLRATRGRSVESRGDGGLEAPRGLRGLGAEGDQRVEGVGLQHNLADVHRQCPRVPRGDQRSLRSLRVRGQIGAGARRLV
jgi:hypothetical protein